MIIDKSVHTFHIPVMGLAYTIDSPIRVAQYGISSVISIVDDELIQKMNAYYSAAFNEPYKEISQKIKDFRSMRITSYLNLVDKIVKQKFEDFKIELAGNKLAMEQFVAMLPNSSDIKMALYHFISDPFSNDTTIKNFLDNHLKPGSIDVNIMTKVDKENFDGDTPLPSVYNDAHTALKGFAESNLESAVVLSAGMNPRLYSYFENFTDFFPDEKGHLKKKIIIKVSDFRSAMIQGNFLAKKGLWVSEYRIESGLNCGGHAFATDGLLLGPILNEFVQKKHELVSGAFELLTKALQGKGLPAPEVPMPLHITIQGGVGTAEEHEFLLSRYKVDSVGWGSPFLLVPEATSVDIATRELLCAGTEKDFYLSHISPLGIPFNTIKGTTNEMHRDRRIHHNKPGSSCPKKLLALSREFDDKGLCMASRKYQEIKLTNLEIERHQLSTLQYEKQKAAITEKSCLCVGLANASYLENNIAIKGQEQGVVICPGPNLAYFDKTVSLYDMVRHIYGGHSVMTHRNRPNMFVKELQLYVDYLQNEIEENSSDLNAAKIKKWGIFKNNLIAGIDYYQQLFQHTQFFRLTKRKIFLELEECLLALQAIAIPELEPAQ